MTDLIECALQIKQGILYPYTDQDREALKQFKENQVLVGKLKGYKKPRSLQQLGLYWNRCDFVAQLLSDHEHQWSREDIDFEVKIRVAKQNPAMIRRYKALDGVMYMEPISIAFVNMDHLVACKYFDKAFPVMAKMIGATVEDLLNVSAS